MISVFGLMLINLLMIRGLDSSLFWRQLIYWLIGGLAFFGIKKLGSENLFRWTKAIYISLIVFLIMPLAFGQTIRGTTRWITFGGITLQPSELAKPFLIGWFSYYLTKRGIGNLIEFIIDLLLILIPFSLIMFQPDLGSAGLILMTLLLMLIIRKPKLNWWAPMAIIGLITIIFSWSQLLQPYQVDRITSFLNPGLDPLGRGYNQLQAKIAIGAGGLFGRGFGLGRQTQLAFLPERQTDFILAAIGEELGFLGILFTLSFYFYLFYSMIKKIRQTTAIYVFNLRMGIFILIFLQTTINLAMNLQLFPVVGMPLPLLSYGGSSLISTLFGLGLFYS